MKLKYKRAQTEVIVTVLLILIGIIAVGLVSAWVISMVRNNLQGTECFQTTSQLNFVLDDYSILNRSAGATYVSIERLGNDFNLTGLDIIFSYQGSSQTFRIRDGKNTTTPFNVSMYPNSYPLYVPGSLQRKTYNISMNITFDNVKIVPVILLGNKERSCSEGSIEAVFPIKA